MTRRRVVITGLGPVSAAGLGHAALRAALFDEPGGSSADRVDGPGDNGGAGEAAERGTVGPVRAFDASGFKPRLAAEAPAFDVRRFVPKTYRKSVKVMARDVELAVISAKLALDNAGLRTRADLAEGESASLPSGRLGCQIGAGLIAAEVNELTRALSSAAVAREDGGLDADADEFGGAVSMLGWGNAPGPDGEQPGNGMNNLTPLWLLKYLPNMLACHVTIVHDARGPSNTITCAEASGLLSIGESMRVIDRGDADAAFSGGAESKLNHLALVRMEMAGVAAEIGAGEDALDAVQPYAESSRGSLVGESAGILMLECAEAAARRGAGVRSKLLGFGAGHTPAGESLDDRSDGLVIAIEAALRDAGVGADEIDAAVLGSTGMRRRDEAEAHALRRVFGERSGEVELIVLPPAIGTSVAGQGGVMAAVASRALEEQRLPARINRGETPDDILAEAAPARRAELRRVLVATDSLGGQNAALVLGRA